MQLQVIWRRGALRQGTSHPAGCAVRQVTRMNRSFGSRLRQADSGSAKSPVPMLLPCCRGDGIEAQHGRKPVKSRACVRMEDDHEQVWRGASAGMATEADVGTALPACCSTSRGDQKNQTPPLLQRLEWLG